MTMRATVLCCALILCAWSVCCAGEAKTDAVGDANAASQLEKGIHSAEKVELFFVPVPASDKDPTERLVLEKKEEVQEFISLVALKPKPACKCEHGKMLRFTTGKERITASICSQCFDVVHEGKVRNFTMPQELWVKFCEYEEKHKGKEKAK